MEHGEMHYKGIFLLIINFYVSIVIMSKLLIQAVALMLEG